MIMKKIGNYSIDIMPVVGLWNYALPLNGSVCVDDYEKCQIRLS